MNSLTPCQQIQHYGNKTWHICTKLLINKDTVADHCHPTVEYRDTAHNKCKLSYGHTWQVSAQFCFFLFALNITKTTNILFCGHTPHIYFRIFVTSNSDNQKYGKACLSYNHT